MQGQQNPWPPLVQHGVTKHSPGDPVKRRILKQGGQGWTFLETRQFHGSKISALRAGSDKQSSGVQLPHPPRSIYRTAGAAECWQQAVPWGWPLSSTSVRFTLQTNPILLPPSPPSSGTWRGAGPSPACCPAPTAEGRRKICSRIPPPPRCDGR